MIKRIFLIALLGTAPCLLAQTPTYKQVLDGLSKAAPAAAINLPAGFFAQPETDARGKLQRGVVLYAAAGRARELGNRERAPVLITSSKSYLQSALNGLTSAQAAEKCQANYTLGQIAESWDGNLSSAQTYYQNAINQQASHAPAQAALARVQRILQGNP